jgi:hypothetical protein
VARLGGSTGSTTVPSPLPAEEAHQRHQDFKKSQKQSKEKRERKKHRLVKHWKWTEEKENWKI